MTRLVIPGDFVAASSVAAATNRDRVVGAGLERRADGIYATVAGVLHETEGKMWISYASKRYIPHAGDRVLGKVTGRAGDYFTVNIGSADTALLSFLQFEAATKRNRPSVRIGDLVYAQVVLSSKNLEPELSCIDAEGRARGMGVIATAGLVISVTLNHARRLLSAEDTFLSKLGKELKFETTIGMNGRIWISGGKWEVLAVRDAILEAETAFSSNLDLIIKRSAEAARAGPQSQNPMCIDP